MILRSSRSFTETSITTRKRGLLIVTYVNRVLMKLGTIFTDYEPVRSQDQNQIEIRAWR